MNKLKNLSEILRRNAAVFGPVLAADLSGAAVCRLDFTAANTYLQGIDLRHTPHFNEAVDHMLQQQQASIGVGGYLEDRFIYRRSQHFDVAAESRSLHLGVDVWIAAGTPVLAPLDGVVHSFRDNNNFGDYGPTIILAHELEEVTFYTLYGHLSRTSVTGMAAGKQILKGEAFATVGPYPENGDWPPHLHFQVMADMQGKSGDFPGVATTSERAIYEELCPNPNLILKCPHLPL